MQNVAFGALEPTGFEAVLYVQVAFDCHPEFGVTPSPECSTRSRPRFDIELTRAGLPPLAGELLLLAVTVALALLCIAFAPRQGVDCAPAVVPGGDRALAAPGRR